MTDDFPRLWLRNFIDSGLVRAVAEGGATRGTGTRGRGGSYNAVMIYLAILAHDEGSPSMTELQRLTGIGSKNTIKAAIETLEALGAIKVGRYQDGNEYEVLRMPDLGLPQGASTRRSGRHRPERIDSFTALDGHVLRSPVELVVDLLLDLHGIAHATEVPYSAIVPHHSGKHTLDFLLTPTMGIEVWGSSGPDYKETRILKERVASEAGFNLVGVEELADAYKLVPHLKASVGTNFGNADLDQLRQLLKLFRLSPAHRETLPGFQRLLARHSEVENTTVVRSVEPEDGTEIEPGKIYVRGYGVIDKRAFGRPQTEEELLIHSDADLRQARDEMKEAAKYARWAADRLAEKIEVSESGTALAWGSRALDMVKEARGHIGDADVHVVRAEIALRRTITPPEDEHMRAARLRREQVEREEQELREKRDLVAMRLLKRVEAALRGEDDPYAKSDERKRKAAKRERLRAAIEEACPELFAAARVQAGERIDDAIDDLEDDLALSEIL